MKSFPLSKKNKLCSVIAINALFSGDGTSSFLSYPLRAVWRVNVNRKADTDVPKMLISVPKRRLHHAVDRVQMRRRIREAYRLNRLSVLEGIDEPIEIAFIYVSDKKLPYRSVERAMLKLLTQIAAAVRKDSGDV